METRFSISQSSQPALMSNTKKLKPVRPRPGIGRGDRDERTSLAIGRSDERSSFAIGRGDDNNGASTSTGE